MHTVSQPSEPNASSPAEVGLLLVGHGTRDQIGLAEFHELRRLLVERAGDMPVAACFLELTEPSIAEGIANLLARGVRQIVVAPLLLFAAGHAKRDIPDGVADALEQLVKTNPAAESARVLCQLPPLACHEKLLELSALRYEAARPIFLRAGDSAKVTASQPGFSAATSTTLVLVGRGSSDAEAIAEMHRFANLRGEQLPGVKVEVCFYALAEPRLEPTLAAAAKSPATRVVVQPHLLFSGEVRSGIAELAERYAAEVTDRQQWLLTEPLGPHQLLAETLWAMQHPSAPRSG